MTASEFRTKADAFTKAYVEAALWSSSAELGECDDCEKDRIAPEHDTNLCPLCGDGYLYGMDRSFTDLCMCIEECAPETLDKFIADCKAFQAECGEWIISEYRKVNGAESGVVDNTIDSYAGHDFWLTRCGHGAGFFDGDWVEPAATQLTQASRLFGNIDLYLGDDGLIYQ